MDTYVGLNGPTLQSNRGSIIRHPDLVFTFFSVSVWELSLRPEGEMPEVTGILGIVKEESISIYPCRYIRTILRNTRSHVTNPSIYHQRVMNGVQSPYNRLTTHSLRLLPMSILISRPIKLKILSSQTKQRNRYAGRIR